MFFEILAAFTPATAVPGRAGGRGRPRKTGFFQGCQGRSESKFLPTNIYGKFTLKSTGKALPTGAFRYI
jgi:hypothetical protein